MCEEIVQMQKFDLFKMEVSCVHADRETAVARKMGIKVIPSVVLLLDSHPYHYRETTIAANKVICK
jgi:thioredoxin-like negative regulator of GroEL